MSHLVRLGDHATKIGSGQTPRGGHHTYATKGVPLIRSQNVLMGAFSPGGLAYISTAIDNEMQGSRVVQGDVLLNITGASIGRVCVVPDEFCPANVNQHVCIIRCKDSLDSHYVSAVLASPRFQDFIWQSQAGGTRQALTKQMVEDFEIPWRPLNEQREIATRLKAQLAEVDCARQAALTQRESAEALMSAIYREAFAQVVPVAAPPATDHTPAGWQWRKLTEVARLESGHTPSRSRPDWWGGDVSWISLTEIRALDGQWVEGTQLRTNPAGIANSAARILPRGTVCYSRTASVGFVAIMAKPMATSQDFANWVCGDALDPEFLMHALIHARKDLRDLATGATHKTIYMPTLESFHVCAPDIDAQRRIVRCLKQRLGEASALRTALDAQQAELARLPQRLLAQAFEN